MPAIACCDDPEACERARMCLADPEADPDVTAEARFRAALRATFDTFRPQPA